MPLPVDRPVSLGRKPRLNNEGERNRPSSLDARWLTSPIAGFESWNDVESFSGGTIDRSLIDSMIALLR